MKNHKHLTIEELKSKMDIHADYILVDVLSKEDFKHAHIKGAINIPLDDLPAKGDQWLNRNIDIIVYSANTLCKGARFAQEKLGTMGFRVWTLDGGLETWENAFYPLEGNPNYKPHSTTDKPKSLQEQPKKPAPKPAEPTQEAKPKHFHIPGQVNVGDEESAAVKKEQPSGHGKKKKAA